MRGSTSKMADRQMYRSFLFKASGLACSLAFCSLCNAQAARPILTPATPPPAPSAAESAPAAAPVGASAPATAPAQPKDVVEADKYIIGPEDQLQITVWKEQNLSGTFPVRPDGMISMVLLGDVRAAGLTPMQLGANLALQLKKYVQDPLVTVLVTQVNSQRIFMVGEVGHVGAIPITPGMTPLQAIASAGGLTPYARKSKIYILRGPQGNQQRIPFNYKAALKGESPQDVALQPGDTVVVP